MNLLALFAEDQAIGHLKALDTAGDLERLIPEITACKGCRQNAYHTLDVWGHTLLVLDNMERLVNTYASLFPALLSKFLDEYLTRRRKTLLKLATLFHDLGKPATKTTDENGEIHFYGHAEKGTEIFEHSAERLGINASDKGTVALIIFHHLRPLELSTLLKRGELTDRAMKKFFRETDEEGIGILLHALADLQSKGGMAVDKDEEKHYLTFCNHMAEYYLQEIATALQMETLVTGKDLIAIFGLQPSATFGEILREVEQAQRSQQVTTREEALAFVKALLRKSNGIME
jgi:putative nucleotidyltransferase with HDIG domain